MAAQDGDTVKVHYTGKLPDGSVFDSSEGRDPLQFTIGAGQVIQGFNATVTGMDVGESRTATFPPEEGYGQKRDDLVLEVPRSEVPDHVVLELGAALELTHETGQIIPVTVTAMTDEQVTLDANHPLAGIALTFDITLVEIM